MKRLSPLLLIAALGACEKQAAQPVLSPEAALAAAWDNYRLSEFDRAAKHFAEAIAGSATNSEAQLQARYGLATTMNLRLPETGQDKAGAAKMYEQIIADAPSGDMVPWCRLALARMKHLVKVGEEPDLAAVRREYQAIVDQFPGHLAAKEAFIYKMSTFVATLEPVQMRYAVACLSRYVSQPGQKAFLQPAWSLLAVSYSTLKMPEQRMAAEIRSLQTTEIDPSNPFNEFGWAYWNIATIAEFDVGDFSTARYFYRKLLKEYPTDIKVFGSKQALKRMDEVEAKLRAEIPPAAAPVAKPKAKAAAKRGGAA